MCTRTCCVYVYGLWWFGGIGMSVSLFVFVDFLSLCVCEEVIWCVTWWEGRMWLEYAPVEEMGWQKEKGLFRREWANPGERCYGPELRQCRGGLLEHIVEIASAGLLSVSRCSWEKSSEWLLGFQFGSGVNGVLGTQMWEQAPSSSARRQDMAEIHLEPMGLSSLTSTWRCPCWGWI